MATAQTTSGKKIATWTGSVGPNHRREITKKQAKTSLSVDLGDDLVWEAKNNFRVDVTNQPKAFVEYLAGRKDFKVSDE